MNNKITKIIDYTLITIGASWSLDNIESVLGIVVLSIQIIWLLAKFIVKLVQICKTSSIEDISKNLDSLDDEVDEIIDSINKVVESTEGENNECEK